MSLSKELLLKKLRAISILSNKILAVKSKINNYEPDDNYERKVILPKFPGEYKNEYDRETLENSVDHYDDDAIEQIGDKYDAMYQPKEPIKENATKKLAEITEQTDKWKQKGCLPIGAAFVGICVLISGGLFSNDKVTVIANLVIILICAAVVIISYVKLNKSKKEDQNATKLALEDHERHLKEIEEKHEKAVQEYQSLLASHNLTKSEFIDKYIEWRNIYLESLKEEEEIEAKLEEDRLNAIAKINEEELTPLLTDLADLNDILTAEYLPAVDTVIDLLESGRADDLKEAINLYEDILYRERQLELQREQEEQRRYEEECRRQDEERRHQEEMELRRKQERERQYEEARREREAERRLKEEKLEQEKQELKRKEDEKREALRKCAWCTNFKNCGMRRNPPSHCTGFIPGSTHQI